MDKDKRGSPYMRKAIQKVAEYPIFGCLYEDREGNPATASIAAESGPEAISLLEKALEEKGYGHGAIVAQTTSFSSSRKGIVYAYDIPSKNLF